MPDYTRTSFAVGLAVLTFSIAFTAAPAVAQTKGRVSVGGSVTLVKPTDSDLDTAISAGPLVRLNPRKGWAPAGAFNWFRSDLKDPAGDGAFAHLQIRPVMVGIGYSVGRDNTLVTFSVVAGPSFNQVGFEEEFANRQGGTPIIDVKNSVAVRPGVSLTQTVAPRVGIVAFGGYLFNRPDVTYRNTAGRQFDDRWRADSVVLSVGLVYSLF